MLAEGQLVGSVYKYKDWRAGLFWVQGRGRRGPQEKEGVTPSPNINPQVDTVAQPALPSCTARYPWHITPIALIFCLQCAHLATKVSCFLLK